MAITLPSQFSTEMKKMGYKPRVGIAISTFSQYLSVTETFTTNTQTYTGKSTGAPSITLAVEPTGGFNKVTSFNLSILNQELFSNIFATYKDPEDTEAVVKLWFDDGTQIQDNEGVQLFKGKIKDFPSINYDSVEFQIETDDDLTDTMLGELVEDSDSSSIPTVGEASIGKVKPIAYGDHTGMKTYARQSGSLSLIHFSQAQSMWKCLWFNEDGAGSNHWIVANHTISEPNLPTTVGALNFWALDDDSDRFVLVQDSDITALPAISGKPHVHVKLAKDVYYFDYIFPTTVSDTSSTCGTGSATVTGDENAIDKDLTTKAVMTAISDDGDSGTCNNDAQLTFTFPQSYHAADDDIAEVRVFVVAATTQEETGGSFTINGTDVFRPQDLNNPTIFDCGTDDATADGVMQSVVSRLREIRDQSGGSNYESGSETYFVFKRIKYKKTHVTGKDDNDDPIISPKKLQLYCAGKGMEYDTWVNSRSQASSGNLIENGSGVIESLYRDHLGLGNVRNADFDSTYSRLSSTKFQFSIEKQTKSKKLIDKLAKQCKASVFFDYDNQLSMRVFPQQSGSTSYFTKNAGDTPNDDDIFAFDPNTNSGSFTQHPIIRDSFSIQKVNNKLINDITINYGKTVLGEFSKTTNNSSSTYVTSVYKDTLNHEHTEDTTTANVWRDFILLRGKRKFWTVTFRTFMNSCQLELFDIINVRHPVINGIFGTVEEIKKKWVVYSIQHSLGPYETVVKVTELSPLTPEG